MLPILLFLIALAPMTVIAALILLQLVKSDFQFWPPPSPQSWQKKMFRALFRIFIGSLIVLSVVDFNPSSPWRYLLGAILLIGGLGIAVHWTGYLGWRNSFGEPTGLKTDGPFARSRNPVYMVTIIGMIGWALLVNSYLLWILLGLWALLYLAAPFIEEPWLESRFGQAYQEYKDNTPRYF